MTTPLDYNAFQNKYTSLKVEIERYKKQNEFIKLSNAHLQSAKIIQLYLTSNIDDNVNQAIKKKLETDFNFHVVQCVNYNTFRLFETSEIIENLNNAKKIKEEIEKLSKDDDTIGGGSQSSNEYNDLIDPENDTSNGLYSIVPNASSQNFESLLGYNDQKELIINALNIADITIDGVTYDKDLNKLSKISKKEIILRSGKKVMITPNGKSTNILLYGPPGTGKTTNAAGFAKYADLTFMVADSSVIVSSYIGETEKNLRNLFSRARLLALKKNNKVVLLIDELDGIIKNRSIPQTIETGDISKITTMLQILEPADGVDNSNLIVFFASNKLSNIDSAVIQRCIPIFMGYIVKPDDRFALLKSIFSEFVNPTTDLNWYKLATLLLTYVPRDYNRIKRTAVKLHLANNDYKKMNIEDLQKIFFTVTEATSINDYLANFDPSERDLVNIINNNPIGNNYNIYRENEQIQYEEIESNSFIKSLFDKYFNNLNTINTVIHELKPIN